MVALSLRCVARCAGVVVLCFSFLCVCRTLDASPTSSGSSSKQVESLKKQLSSLMGERDELTAELDELEARYNDARKAANEAKKTCKAHVAELEDLRVQLVEAQAAASKSPSSARAASAAPSTPSRSSASAAFANLDEEKLREECALLQLRLEELSSESGEKLVSERKLRASLQAQLSAAKTETDQLRARQVRFEDLSVIKSHLDPKKNAKDKLQMDLIAAYEALIKRDRFLESQLKECDQTLLNAKNGWQLTVNLMQEQIANLETEMEELKSAYHMRTHAHTAAAHAASHTPQATGHRRTQIPAHAPLLLSFPISALPRPKSCRVSDCAVGMCVVRFGFSSPRTVCADALPPSPTRACPSTSSRWSCCRRNCERSASAHDHRGRGEGCSRPHRCGHC